MGPVKNCLLICNIFFLHVLVSYFSTLTVSEETLNCADLDLIFYL